MSSERFMAPLFGPRWRLFLTAVGVVACMFIFSLGAIVIAAPALALFVAPPLVFCAFVFAGFVALFELGLMRNWVRLGEVGRVLVGGSIAGWLSGWLVWGIFAVSGEAPFVVLPMGLAMWTPVLLFAGAIEHRRRNANAPAAKRMLGKVNARGRQ